MYRARWYYLLAASAYAASLLAGVFGLVAPRVVAELPWTVWAGLGALSGLVGGVAGGSAGLQHGDAAHLERIRSWSLLLALVALPVLAGIGFLAYVLTTPEPGLPVLGPLFVACSGGLVFAGATVVSAEHLHTTLVTESDDPLVTWSAGRPASRQRRLRRASVVLTGLWLGSIVVVTATSGTVPFWLLPLGVSTTFGLYPDRQREYAALPAGLRRGVSVTSWDRYDGYELTGDALVLRGSGFTGDVRCSRADLADEAAVVAALDEYLDRAQSSPDS